MGPLGIRVTCVEPGPFRTDWAGRSLHIAENRIADYAAVALRLKEMNEKSGTQAGDPVRAVQAMIALAQMDEPPRHQMLGAIGFENVTKRLRARIEEIEAGRDMALRADFPPG